MHASPALVDLSSATIQRRAWLGKVAKNAGKRPAVAAMVDLSSPPIQWRASSDRVWSCPGFPNSWRKITSQPASPDRVWSCPDFPNSWRKIPPQPASTDRVWSCPDFPNSWRKIHPQLAIFRHKFGKPWSCLILSSTDRVWSWSECNNLWRREGEKDKTYFYGFRWSSNSFIQVSRHHHQRSMSPRPAGSN